MFEFYSGAHGGGAGVQLAGQRCHGPGRGEGQQPTSLDAVRGTPCFVRRRPTAAADLPRAPQAKTAYTSARSLLGSVPARICLPLVSPGLLGAGTSARMGTSQLRDGVCGDRPHYCVVAAVNDQNCVGGPPMVQRSGQRHLTVAGHLGSDCLHFTIALTALHQMDRSTSCAGMGCQPY